MGQRLTAQVRIEEVEKPEMGAGDILIGRQMGAYTAASATDFNFFPRARLLVANR